MPVCLCGEVLREGEDVPEQPWGSTKRLERSQSRNKEMRLGCMSCLSLEAQQGAGAEFCECMACHWFEMSKRCSGLEFGESRYDFFWRNT